MSWGIDTIAQLYIAYSNNWLHTVPHPQMTPIPSSKGPMPSPDNESDNTVDEVSYIFNSATILAMLLILIAMLTFAIMAILKIMKKRRRSELQLRQLQGGEGAAAFDNFIYAGRESKGGLQCWFMYEPMWMELYACIIATMPPATAVVRICLILTTDVSCPSNYRNC